jgi:Uma2 family endonuclease
MEIPFPMATVTTEKAAANIDGQRFVFWNIGWEGYQSLLKIVGNRPIRITYDRGNAEIISPLSLHERYKGLIGRMIELITEELDIPAVYAGSTTFNSEALDRGLEPDECYYFSSAVNVHDWARVDLTVDPPPDLAIEVDITTNSLNRLGVYAALGVPELWRYDGEVFEVLSLSPANTYARIEKSRILPFVSMDDLARFLQDYQAGNDTRWARSFRAWVRETLLPRQREE